MWLYDNGHGDFTVICLYNDNVETINTYQNFGNIVPFFPAGSSVDNVDLLEMQAVIFIWIVEGLEGM